MYANPMKNYNGGNMKDNIRKKVISILLAGAMAALLTACGQKELPSSETEQSKAETEQSGAEQNGSEQKEAEPTGEAEPTANQQGEAVQKQTETQLTAGTQQSEERLEDEQAPVTDTAWTLAVSEEPFHIENPSPENYLSETVQAESGMESPDAVPLELTRVSEKTNQIIDTDKWFAEHELSMPSYEDELYTCEIERDNYTSGWRLHIRDKNAPEKNVAVLDFSDYCYAGDFAEADEAYVEQYIHYVARRGYELYVSIGHNTYAASSPHHAYITAVDLRDMSVIWKTEPLVSNAFNFEIIGDVIVCGYGFTAEDDYLKQINIHTGEVLAETVLKSKADYIIRKDDKLYVRTYNTDYIFQIGEGKA